MPAAVDFGRPWVAISPSQRSGALIAPPFGSDVISRDELEDGAVALVRTAVESAAVVG